MVGAVFMALVALSLAVAGLGLLVWWLWQLWGQHEEETTVQAIEIKAQSPTVEPEPPPSVEAEVEPPENGAETIGVEEEAPVEEITAAASAAELETRAVDVDAKAPAAEAEAPASEVETTEVKEEASVEEVTVAEEPAAPTKTDDLKRIEGIGPKIASVLQASGISTYAQLADSNPDQLRKILGESDPRLLRIAHPDTWPEQASLAASGDWDGLQALQNGLRGGKRA